VPLVEHELLTFPQNLSPPQIFSGVRVARSLVFCVVFCWPLFVCLLSIFFWPLCDGFWFSLWYLQSLLH